MTDTKLGPAITAAVRSLKQLYDDLYEFLICADKLMTQRGWQSVKQRQISDDVGVRLTSKSWMVDRLLRIYYAGSDLAAAREIIGVQLYLDPPEPWSEPVCLVARVSFGASLTKNEVWDKWHYTGVEKLLRWLATDPRQPVPARLAVALFGAATSVSEAFVVPLCRLGSELQLGELVVDRVLPRPPRE